MPGAVAVDIVAALVDDPFLWMILMYQRMMGWSQNLRIDQGEH